MSFTTQVKEEVMQTSQPSYSELSAFIKMSGSLGLSGQGLTLSVTTQNAKIARYIYGLFEDLFEVTPDLSYHYKSNLKKNRVYTVLISQAVEAILADLRLADSFFGEAQGISPDIIADERKARDYLRGAFLATGSVTHPETGKYQLEIASVYADHATDLAQLLRLFMLDAKILERKKGTITYLQKAEDIIDFLIVIGAMSCMEEYESVKLMREARNDINRASNAEAANIAKTVTASMKTIDNIIRLRDNQVFEGLSSDLQQIANLRIAHPDYSLAQLGALLNPPLSKSGVNHRLRKLNQLAKEI
ncbi:DNA-binding protein WhiA [Streptococcus sp. DD12]|uniref:DNA-binding protein WhiA n=1 Tax=Streptococcus sp. DD12 TaxID=1777880 RepID=UPI0007983D5F|nr:DNA-binding protein WhiA [Streptococcus sp. DD12]KXT76211.1 putative cytoplasmic protein [Streptococcus sp. DD12]